MPETQSLRAENIGFKDIAQNLRGGDNNILQNT